MFEDSDLVTGFSFITYMFLDTREIRRYHQEGRIVEDERERKKKVTEAGEKRGVYR
jgi:hypothetical protein